MTVKAVDLTDLDLFEHGDPYEAWAWLRRHRPVYWNETPDGGFWALTRYDDVSAAYLDPATFSSRRGTVMGGSFRKDSDTASQQMLIASDAPAHRLMRHHVHKAFLPDLISRAAVDVRRYIGSALDRLQADGGGDFATDVAPELPAGLLGSLFGLDRHDALHLLELTRTMIGFRDPEYQRQAGESATLVSSQVEIFDMMAELAEHRRRAPSDDLVSLLLSATVNGRCMTESEVLYNCLNVAVGGDETTPFTASAAVLTFVEHPDQTERLFRDPALLPTALNEVFRWTSTNAYVQRTANRDVEIGGEVIRAGQSVTLWNAAANRDERRFHQPDRFDVGRNPNPHLVFGLGPHRCVGAAAARMEISILLEQLVHRGLRLRLGGPVRKLRSNFMLGHTHLPVVVASARSGRPVPAPAAACPAPPGSGAAADVIAGLYAEELGLPCCGLADSFFSRGGDSLAAMRVLSRLGERYAVRIPLAEMYRNSSPKALAGALEQLLAQPGRTRSLAAWARRRHRSQFPLALSQRIFYETDRAAGGIGLLNSVARLRLHGDIDPQALLGAVQDTVRRQSALRTMFAIEADEPVQRILDAPARIEEMDLRGCAASKLGRLVRREYLMGFDLHEAPPVRFFLARTADHEWVLVCTAHHIVFDGMSEAILVDELSHAYACRLGEARPRPPLRSEYVDFAEWQREALRGERVEAHLAGLRAMLPCPTPPITPPGGRPDGFVSRVIPFEIPGRTVVDLRALAAESGNTLFAALLAALFAFGRHRTGRGRQLVAVQAANRSWPGSEDLIGCFSNTVYVTDEHDEGRATDPRELMKRAGSSLARALLHEELPLDHALRLLADQGDPAAGPEYLPQIGLALQPAVGGARTVPGGTLAPEQVVMGGDAADPTPFPLVLELLSDDGGLRGATHHRPGEWPQGSFASVHRELTMAFEALSAPEARQTMR